MPDAGFRLPWCAAVVVPLLLSVGLMPAGEGGPQRPAPRRLLMALSSHRDRPRPAIATVYFYEHDGASQGRIIGSIPPTELTSDCWPSLSADGTICAYGSKKVGGNPGLVQLWDVKAMKALELPAFNEGFAARMKPSLSGGGRLLAFLAWDRPGAAGGWDVFLYDTRACKLLDLPGLNSQYDEREPVLSGNGRFIAFVSNRPGGKGLSDIYLYDREAKALVPLPGLNSAYPETHPALSADGRLLAFASDRPGGQGGKDIYLYDRHPEELLPLPGLNSSAHEQGPALSPDGRYVAFVSERTGGLGERDVYLYDRQAAKLLPTPGLNSKHDDFDPNLIYLDRN
jgi:hypothetical protein